MWTDNEIQKKIYTKKHSGQFRRLIDIWQEKEPQCWLQSNKTRGQREILMPCPCMGPNRFWTLQIILVDYELFWTGPICFGRVQIIKISPEKSNLTLKKMLRARPKRFGPDQNDWYSTKMIWSVQNHFGAIEGQGISLSQFLQLEPVWGQYCCALALARMGLQKAGQQ